jgi:molybdopterin-binding protein
MKLSARNWRTGRAGGGVIAIEAVDDRALAAGDAAVAAGKFLDVRVAQ